MAKITTFEGQHWFFLGCCADANEALQKAQRYACVNLKGTESQVKKVVTKNEWLRKTKVFYTGGRLKMVEDELL